MNKEILRLAIPNIITTITVPLLGMVDLAIVGHLGSEKYIGAIAIGTMIFNFIYWNFGFLRMSTSGFTAQAYGAKEDKEIITILLRALYIAGFVSLFLILFQFPIKKIALFLVKGSAEVEHYASLYFNICIWAAPATLGLYVFKGWFIGMQNSKMPMYIAIVINVLNIGLSFFFVYVLHMKIEGIALGTVLAQYAGLIMAIVLWMLYYKKYMKFVAFKDIFSLQKTVQFFKVNADIFLRTFCLIIVFTFIPAQGAKMGDEVLAANLLLMQFFTLFSYIIDGFAYAGESLVGKYIGAKNEISVRLSIQYLFRWGFLLSVIFVLFYAFGGKYLLLIFTDNRDIIAFSHNYYYWVLAVPIAGFAAFLWDGILIGATATKAMRNAIFVATAVFFVLYYSLYTTLGNNALWLAFIFFLAFRGILQTLFAKKAIFNALKMEKK